MDFASKVSAIKPQKGPKAISNELFRFRHGSGLNLKQTDLFRYQFAQTASFCFDRLATAKYLPISLRVLGPI